MNKITEEIFLKFFLDQYVRSGIDMGGEPRLIADKHWMFYKRYQEKYKIKFETFFLAQVAHESMGFSKTEESCAFSTKRLFEVFPKYFSDLDPNIVERDYAGKSTIFDRVYANRLGNGDEQSKDGSRFRGRGLIQLTGKRNYTLFNYHHIPTDLRDLPGCWECAFKYWTHFSIDQHILDCSDTPIRVSTKIINGGYNGLEDRNRRFSILQKMVAESEKDRKKTSPPTPKKVETELPIPDIPKEWLYFVAGGLAGWFLKSIFTPKEKKSSPK